MMQITTAQRDVIERDWPAGVDVNLIRERLNALIPSGGRRYHNNRQVMHSAHQMNLSRVRPIDLKFSAERDARLREMRPASVPNIDILAALLKLPGVATITARDITRRSAYLGIYRPAGYRDDAAASRNGKTEKSLATLAANRELHRLRRLAADPATLMFSPARDALLKKMRAAAAAPRDIQAAVALLPGLPVTVDQCGKRAAYLGAYALAQPPKPPKAPKPPRAPRMRVVKAKPVAAAARPVPERAVEPAIIIPSNRGFVRMSFGAIRHIALRDAVTLPSAHDLQRYNEARQKRGDPALYLPLTDRGRAMV